jgi:predicted dehydrogenase
VVRDAPPGPLVLGDIGTHAHQLVCFATGLPFESVSAEVGTLQLPGHEDVASVDGDRAGTNTPPAS